MKALADTVAVHALPDCQCMGIYRLIDTFYLLHCITCETFIYIFLLNIFLGKK